MLKPGNIRCMLEIDSTAVGTKFMSKIDKKITPFLAELITLGWGNYDDEHPTVKALFNWLVDSDRTGEEFYYVVGPLQEYVLKVMMEHFRLYVHSNYHGYAGIPGEHVGRIAAEALAVIRPILEGPWEQVAWVLLKESSKRCEDDYLYASDKLTAWLIHVIGDPVLCPNSYLRIELIHLLNLVDFEQQDQRKLQPKAVESILFACSYLNVEYLLESKPQYGHYHHMDIEGIMLALKDNTKHIEEEFDEKLAKELQNVKSSRLTAHVHDVAYHYSINSNKFEEPILLKGLTNILKTIQYYLQLNYIHYQDNNSNLYSDSNRYESPTFILMTFINIFRKSCWTPHLITLIATCMLTSIEIVKSEYAITNCSASIGYNIEMLEDMFDETLYSPENQSSDSEYMTVLVKYIERLKKIKINCL